jgi:transcriptional regulatory protein LevR
VCDSVLRGLDTPLRQAVADVMQAEHRVLMQDLRAGLLVLVQNQVRDALAAELGSGSKVGQKLLSGN